MSFNSLFSRERNRVWVADGATGTNLQQRGLEKGEPGEKWVLEHPEKIRQLYSDFIEAGSDIILTCTFGASEFLLKQHDLSESQEKIVNTAVSLAKEAIGEKEAGIRASIRANKGLPDSAVQMLKEKGLK